MDFDATSPEDLAGVIAENIGKSVNYHPVNTDGAKKAASMILGILNKGDASHNFMPFKWISLDNRYVKKYETTTPRGRGFLSLIK